MYCEDINIDRAENGFTVRLCLKEPIKNKKEVSELSDAELAPAMEDGYKTTYKEYVAGNVQEVMDIISKYLSEPKEKSPAAEGADDGAE